MAALPPVIYLGLLLGLLHGSSMSQGFFGDRFLSLSLLNLGLGVASVGAFALKRLQRRTMVPLSPPTG